jgi:hypothetical protein
MDVIRIQMRLMERRLSIPRHTKRNIWTGKIQSR